MLLVVPACQGYMILVGLSVVMFGLLFVLRKRKTVYRSIVGFNFV
jgi:LPXTG-motif cell wall-anchored protein